MLAVRTSTPQVWLAQESTAGLWLVTSEEGHFGGDLGESLSRQCPRVVK